MFIITIFNNTYNIKPLFYPCLLLLIKFAIKNAKPRDIILLAGKGHETYQILPTGTIHFDEREVIQEVLEELKK